MGSTTDRRLLEVRDTDAQIHCEEHTVPAILTDHLVVDRDLASRRAFEPAGLLGDGLPAYRTAYRLPHPARASGALAG